ncbi:Type 1 glutamine amidotransferase-like domain-containing protein [Christensenellaceae bacterium OttesenSCG-928-L17]|nr:Type 1 glutamine amidotransferase-like domain-containing protein [Christensenellaceae bacterium OttesenSCG-928-L17]
MKAIILHGTGNDWTGNWIPWTKAQLEDRGYEVYAPSLPDSDYPNAQKWASYVIENVPFQIDNETIIVGHSAGATLIPQLLQELPGGTKIKKAVLVSGFHTNLGWDKLSEIQNIKVDYDKVKKMADDFILIYSDTDPYVPTDEAEWLAEKLNGRLKMIKGQGHFNLEASPKYKEFPKLLAVILKGDSLQQLYLASSFRQPGVADMIMGDIEKKLGKSGTEIKIAFITTAANLHPADKRDWIDDGREILKARKWQIVETDIADKTEEEVKTELDGCNVIFVEGGQPIYMLEQVQKCNFGKIVKEALARGVMYIGESTGSIITGQNIEPYGHLAQDKRENPPVLSSYEGMGLVNFFIRPHWNRQGAKRQRDIDEMRSSVSAFYNISEPVIALNDTQLVYVDGDQFQIWSVGEER